MIGASLAGMLGAAGGRKLLPIEYVGGTTGTTAGTTSSWTISLTGLTGGLDSAPAAGDFVVVFYGVGGAGESAALALSVTGYAEAALVFSDDSNEAHTLCATKILTTDDTSISLSQTFSTVHAGAAVIHVFRNVDPDNPMDVAAEPRSRVNSVIPLFSNIAPATPGAWVVAGAAGGHTRSTGVYTSSDLSGFLSVVGNSTRDVTVGSGYIENASGTVSPAPFGFTGADGSTFAAGSVLIALRPAPAP